LVPLLFTVLTVLICSLAGSVTKYWLVMNILELPEEIEGRIGNTEGEAFLRGLFST